MLSYDGFQETVAATDNNLRWKVDSYFPEAPIGDGDDQIPPEDVTVKPTFYYNRERPTWNDVFESSAVIVYCKSI